MLEELEESRARVPRHSRTSFHYERARRRNNGHEFHLARWKLSRKRLVLPANLIEARFAISHKIHLVHGDDEMLNAEQTCDHRMASRLTHHA